MVHREISTVASWEACFEKFNPEGINRNMILIKNMEKWFHQCICTLLGLNGKLIPSYS